MKRASEPIAERRSVLGVGPLLFLAAVLSGAPLFVLHYRYYPLFAIEAGPRWLLPVIGCVLLAVGLPFYVAALAALRRALKEDRLVTRGVYRMCRHPLYAAWILLIVPGILVWFRSWILLAIPAAMYLAFRMCVGREERRLEKKFGQQYLDYKEVVNALFPRPCTAQDHRRVQGDGRTSRRGDPQGR